MCSKSVAFWFSVALTMTDANRVSRSETGLQALPQGAEVLLLLKSVGERLQIAFTYYGAFGIQDGTIAPLVTRDDFVSEYRNVPATTALADMIAKAHSSKQ